MPDGEAVLLPTGSAIQRKFWPTGLPSELLKADASMLSGCEFRPPAAVAKPFHGKFKSPRTVAAPLTSMVEAGVVVPKPILPVEPEPVCVMIELVMSVAVSHKGTVFAVPPDVVTFEEGGGGRVFDVELAATMVALVVPATGGAASTKADGGSPPMVCASAAFKA